VTVEFYIKFYPSGPALFFSVGGIVCSCIESMTPEKDNETLLLVTAVIDSSGSEISKRYSTPYRNFIHGIRLRLYLGGSS